MSDHVLMRSSRVQPNFQCGPLGAPAAVWSAAEARSADRSPPRSLHAQLLAADAGLRFGIIPESGMPDADVRLLGPATLPLRSSFPKPGPLLTMIQELRVQACQAALKVDAATLLAGEYAAQSVRGVGHGNGVHDPCGLLGGPDGLWAYVDANLRKLDRLIGRTDDGVQPFYALTALSAGRAAQSRIARRRS
jgi:hypothetical protein